ncbi:UbiA family prenyltransferase [Candidatus Woesearchaeota archaeon]|nr:UbiA family prenyltransferase [Candidatus Woesearchaeota archaeon]
MTKLSVYVDLIRVRQWYKNLVVFLALFFIGQLFDLHSLFLTLLAFLSLSFISSSNYIINDLVDVEKDRLHPEKKLRSLPSGRMKVSTAIVIAVALLGFGFYLGFLLGSLFFVGLVLFFLFSQIYTFFLKHILCADILTIATLFVTRALLGAFAINVTVSPWLILCPFFLSLFMSIGKRHGEVLFLKEKAVETRKVLDSYSLGLTNALMNISTALLVISYALYSFLSNYTKLIYTLPLALFVIFRYFYLIHSGSIIARHPEKVITDKEMVIGIALWTLLTLVIMYSGLFN